MKYAFLADNYRDLIFFENIINNDGYVPVNIFWDNQKKEKNLNNEINIYVPNIALQLSKDKNYLEYKYKIDYDFILEYYYKMYNNDQKRFNIDLLPRINYLYFYFNDLIKDGDIIVTTNSGYWLSRLISEICKIKKATCYYFENFFFNKNFQISQLPFTQSKFGLPELNIIFNDSVYNDSDIEFYDNYIKSKSSKYLQENTIKIEKEYDIFIVGQIPNDTNVILLDRPYENTGELCYNIAKENPNLKIIYKPHPLLDERKIPINNKVFELENVFVTTHSSIHDIFSKSKIIYTISSTVGIEALLHGKDVKWFSNTTYQNFHLENKENIYKFINACRKYMFTLDKLSEKLKNG